VVDFSGRYHRIPEAGINPLPAQRPIPLWIGGTAEVVMARIGKLADGWFPQVQPGPRLDHDLALITQHAAAAGRDPSQIEMEGRITVAPGAEEQWRAQTDAWRATGATHLSINTMGAGRTPQQHIDTIERYMQVVN
jgi:alkanesulfonate monooxygenase SsuD/methylene tetrahydromethanopterin reductase-like flavin-dependent oxidoreductase (luciferase family)